MLWWYGILGDDFIVLICVVDVIGVVMVCEFCVFLCV